MASAHTMKLRFVLSVLLLLGLGLVFGSEKDQQLSERFYANKCPNVEKIVRRVVDQKYTQTATTAPATLRLFFHDCLVEGCDGSAMILSTPNNVAERDYEDNKLAVVGYDTVIKAKQAVEAACPNTVSCADVLVIATRDAVNLAGGPYYKVELGRRDGRVSQASKCRGNIPEPSFNADQLLDMFSKIGLSTRDLVALSGAHTLGFAHCTRFHARLYPSVDPSLNTSYASQLRKQCPRTISDPTVRAVHMDPGTPNTFDNNYFKNLQSGKGIFFSDQVLNNDKRTRRYVREFATNPSEFNVAFAEAMRKLGRVGVKTGKQGEIHRDCTRIN